MSPTQALPRITENHIVSGLLPGFAQPVAVIKVMFAARPEALPRLHAIDTLLAQQLPGYQRQWHASAYTQDLLGAWLVYFLDCLHLHTLAPDLGPGRAEPLAPTSQDQWHCCVLYPVPGPQHAATNFALHWLIKLFHGAEVQIFSALKASLSEVLERFAQQTPFPVTLNNYLKAARKLDIPWQHLCNNVYQYGWGARAHLLDGSFTEATANLGTRIALHKVSLHHVLRSGGIPMPDQIVVRDANQALKAASHLGYPVVVKPVDRDRGEGVSPNLHSPEEVEAAVGRAAQYSEKLLVQPHHAGADYRVYVMHGEVIQVIRRLPGQVSGNGKDSIKALLKTLNASPIRQPAAGRRSQIPLDAEALALLTQQGYTPDSVPAAGTQVNLRRTPNVSTGGETETVPLENIHPDNLRLFCRTVRLLRLDLAGLDFLSTDISNSWLDNGAVICEANAQPQHSPQLAEVILSRLVSGTGRIPVAVIVENRAHVAWLDTLIQQLHDQGVRAGVVREQRLELDQQLIARGNFDACYGAQQLLRDPQLDCLIIQVSTVAMLHLGLPVDRIDALVLSGITGFPADLNPLAQELSSRSQQVLIDQDSALWKQPGALFQQPSRVSETALATLLFALLAAPHE